MRRLPCLPKTDIDLLKKEVLSYGRKAALPMNLPDGWLRKIARDLLYAQQVRSRGIEDDPSIDLTGPILLVLALRSETTSRFSIDTHELKDELDQYALALSDEILTRQTGIRIDRASDVF